MLQQLPELWYTHSFSPSQDFKLNSNNSFLSTYVFFQNDWIQVEEKTSVSL